MARYWWLLGPRIDCEQIRLTVESTNAYLCLHLGVVHDGWEGHVSCGFSYCAN